MMLSSHKAETEFSGEGIPATHEIVYLVKQPLYEFCFAIPKNQAIFESNGGPLLQVYFSGQSQLHALVLRMGQAEDFFDGLSRLMGDIYAEVANREGQV